MTFDPTALGVPQDAMTRLSELRPDRPGSIFTSDLTVNEFLLVARPVSGRWGWSWVPPSTTSACRSAGGARTRSWTCCPRRCTTPGSWR